MTEKIRSISFIGAGNVAWHLAGAFYEKGITIKQVYSRTTARAQELALKVSAGFTTDFSGIEPTADLYIIAVTDDIIPDIPKKIDFQDKLTVHTAGSVPVSVFEGKLKNYGVFYPLQTFTKNRKIELTNVPFCIEANKDKNLRILFKTAQLLSANIHSINSEERKKLHLAAVVAGNFTNYMYNLADEYLAGNRLSFDLLKPLIRETAEKIGELAPFAAQTGPAMRNNTKILEEHLYMLKENPQLKKIYELLSRYISEIYSGSSF